MSKWTCKEPGCTATGEASDRKAAIRALDRHVVQEHTEDER